MRGEMHGESLLDRPSCRLPGNMRASVSGSQEHASNTQYARATGTKIKLLSMILLVVGHWGLQII